MIIEGFDLVMRAYTWWYMLFGSIDFVKIFIKSLQCSYCRSFCV